MHSLIVEIAPALAIHRVIDFALKSVPDAEPGMLYTERQFGILELHSMEMASSSGRGARSSTGSAQKPRTSSSRRSLYTEIVEEVTDQHAVILNRNREASMILPGECLLLVEMVPALFAAYAANEAEKAAPEADARRLPDDRRVGAGVRFGQRAPTWSVHDRALLKRWRRSKEEPASKISFSYREKGYPPPSAW